MVAEIVMAEPVRKDECNQMEGTWMVKEEGFLVEGRSPLIAWGEEHLTPRAVVEINGEGDVYEVSRTVHNRC